MHISRHWLALASLIAFPACSSAPTTGESEPSSAVSSAVTTPEITFPVTIRGTGTATLAGHVYSNPGIRVGLNVVAVGGVAETGTVFGPLAQAIFNDSVLKFVVKTIIGVDFPGRGDSTFPTNLPPGVQYGDLTIEDDASMTVQAVDAARHHGFPSTVLLGHSLGGLDVLIAQQQLLAQNSSLAAHGILSAVVLSPVPGQPLNWTPPPGDLSPFIVNDPTLGTFLNLPPAVWIPVAFTLNSGAIAPDAPTADQIAAARYVGPEPIGDLGELGGPQRPTLNAGSFALAHGTILKVVGFSQDTVVQSTFMQPLYELVTGDTNDLLLRQVVAPDAAHGMLVSNPTGLLAALHPSL